MKKSILTMGILALTFNYASPALAEDGLIEVPKDSQVVKSSNLYKIGNPNTGGTVDDYVNWVSKHYEAQKQNFSSQLAINFPLRKIDLLSQDEISKMNQFQRAKATNTLSAKCLKHKEAFGYKFLPNGDILVNCFAANPSDKSKAITHLIQYRFQSSYTPKDCESKDRAKKYFAVKENRTPEMAAAYNTAGSCILGVTAKPGESPVVEIIKLSPEAVTAELTKRNSLRAYVTGEVIEDSKKPKTEEVAPLFPIKIYDDKDGSTDTE